MKISLQPFGAPLQHNLRSASLFARNILVVDNIPTLCKEKYPAHNHWPTFLPDSINTTVDQNHINLLDKYSYQYLYLQILGHI